MCTIKRIAIIGNAGSGKSTLAKKLHALYKLPLYHLDQYFWKPGWVRPDLAEYEKTHNYLCDQEEWIIDGMNLKYLDYRASRADIIIFLDLPQYLCFWRIFKRYFTYRGKNTPFSAPGCPEKLDWAFLNWVRAFKKKHRSKVYALLKNYENTKLIYILKSQKEIDQFLKKDHDAKT